MKTTVTTGFGYVIDASGHIIGKYSGMPKGDLNITDGQTYTEVTDQATLDKVSIYVEPVKGFNVDKFVQELMIAFQADINMLVYYAVIKDLAIFKNFYGLNILVNGLLAANKITSTEVTALNAVLARQNIVLSTFTTPPS